MNDLSGRTTIVVGASRGIAATYAQTGGPGGRRGPHRGGAN